MKSFPTLFSLPRVFQTFSLWLALLLWAAPFCAQAKEFRFTPDQGFPEAIQSIAEFRKANPDYAQPVTAVFEDGVYLLRDTVILDASISGTEKSPTIFRAAEGAQPIFSGGTSVWNWKINEKGHWTAPLPDGLTPLSGIKNQKNDWTYIPAVERRTENDRMITQLFVNAQRRFRPRFPKRGDGYLFIEEKIPPTTAIQGDQEHNKKQCDDQFRFAQTNGKNDLPASFENQEDVEVVSIHHWNASRLPIRGIDSENRVLRTAPTGYSSYWAGFMKGHPYFLDNVKETLGQPGDWYFDRKANLLTYVPREGEVPENSEVTIPRLQFLLTIGKDDSAVKYVQFHGLTFAYASWAMPEGGQHHAQAEYGMKAAVNLTAASRCVFEKCCFRHFGAYGIQISKGSEFNVIRDCDLVDLGAGGIQINGNHNSVLDSTIRGVGRLHPAGIGVMIGRASFNTIQNCDIFDLYYSSTSIGWTWGYGDSHANHNVVAWNHMHTIGQGLLSDMGAVYTLGVSPGTRIEFNRIHDVQSFGYGGWGLYTDEGSTDIVMRGNTVFRTKCASFHQHYGKENRIEENIFVDGQEQQLQRTRTEEHKSFFFRKNIVAWSNQSNIYGSNWRDDNFVVDENLYFNPNQKELKFPGKGLEEWQDRGHDKNSLVNVDPLFVDWANDDYRLKPDSPVFKLGFKEPPKDNQPGRRTQTSYLNIPEVPSAFDAPKKK